MPPWGAVLQRLEEVPEARLLLFGRHAERLEEDALDVLPVNTNGARAEFDAAEHHVVGERVRRARAQRHHHTLARQAESGPHLVNGDLAAAVRDIY